MLTGISMETVQLGMQVYNTDFNMPKFPVLLWEP